MNSMWFTTTHLVLPVDDVVPVDARVQALTHTVAVTIGGAHHRIVISGSPDDVLALLDAMRDAVEKAKP